VEAAKKLSLEAVMASQTVKDGFKVEELSREEL
jgi:hypothetical protein